MVYFWFAALAQWCSTFFLNHSMSDIRDDIMSPRTATNTNLTSTGNTETSEVHKNQPTEWDVWFQNVDQNLFFKNRISLIPMKLCQSAPPLNRTNIRQATLRPFTPRYSSISARLRLTRHMPFRLIWYKNSFFLKIIHFLQRCIISSIMLYFMVITGYWSTRLVRNA